MKVEHMIPSSFIQYMIELRQRILRCLYMVLALFSVLCYFANDLFYCLARPLLAQLPPGQHLIATNVATPLVTPLKFSFIVAVVLACPYWLHQLWSFIAPGLYRKERFLVQSILIPSVVLFFMGIAFTYFVVLPMTFRFFANVLPVGVALTPDINQYLDFTLQLFLAFGIAFEIPIFTVVCILSGLVSLPTLSAKRPYVIVLAFILGMLLSPPDVLSQVLLAVPMCILFELGLLIARILLRKNARSFEQNLA